MGKGIFGQWSGLCVCWCGNGWCWKGGEENRKDGRNQVEQKKAKTLHPNNKRTNDMHLHKILCGIEKNVLKICTKN